MLILLLQLFIVRVLHQMVCFVVRAIVSELLSLSSGVEFLIAVFTGQMHQTAVKRRGAEQSSPSKGPGWQEVGGYKVGWLHCKTCDISVPSSTQLQRVGALSLSLPPVTLPYTFFFHLAGIETTDFIDHMMGLSLYIVFVHTFPAVFVKTKDY